MGNTTSTQSLAAAATLGTLVGATSAFLCCKATCCSPSSSSSNSSTKYSLADQPARHALAVRTNNTRVLHSDRVFITQVVQSRALRDKRVLVTGGNRGLGLSLVEQLVRAGAVPVATCRKTSPELEALGVHVITGVDVRREASMDKLVREVRARVGAVDWLISSAGYFYEEEEKLDSLVWEEEIKMIDICAVGMLRVSSALVNAGLVTEKVAWITSQGGSVAWRDVQNPDGGDYGHHASKAAANIMGKLLSKELEKFSIPVVLLHPGFNRTEMTAKYSDIWDEHGAVEPEIGAMRVLLEVHALSMTNNNGCFINCEDGLQIPW